MAARWGETRIEGVLFDKDGTLFDFQKSWGALGAQVIHTLSAGEPRLAAQLAEVSGFDLATERYRAGSPLVAGSIDQIVAGWTALLPDWEKSELERWLATQAATAAMRDLAPASEDLPGLLDRLRDAGLTLGVATHDAELAARTHLKRVGALDRFAFLAGYDSGHGLKPGPGMLQAFSAETGVAVERVVVVGDSVQDLGMARSGGAAAAIGVLTGPADEAHLAPLADRVIGSIEALPTLLGV